MSYVFNFSLMLVDGSRILGACDWLMKLGYYVACVSAGAKMQPVSILDTEKLIVETKATSSLMHDGLDE